MPLISPLMPVPQLETNNYDSLIHESDSIELQMPCSVLMSVFNADFTTLHWFNLLAIRIVSYNKLFTSA